MKYGHVLRRQIYLRMIGVGNKAPVDRISRGIVLHAHCRPARTDLFRHILKALLRTHATLKHRLNAQTIRRSIGISKNS
jgi:hypothetical protein